MQNSKSDNWKIAIDKMRKELVGLEGEARLELQHKIDGLENAIRMRDSLPQATK